VREFCRAVFNWQGAVGKGQLAKGSWQKAVGNLQKAVGKEQLAKLKTHSSWQELNTQKVVCNKIN
jgi:hypothetical protein